MAVIYKDEWVSADYNDIVHSTTRVKPKHKIPGRSIEYVSK